MSWKESQCTWSVFTLHSETMVRELPYDPSAPRAYTPSFTAKHPPSWERRSVVGAPPTYHAVVNIAANPPCTCGVLPVWVIVHEHAHAVCIQLQDAVWSTYALFQGRKIPSEASISKHRDRLRELLQRSVWEDGLGLLHLPVEPSALHILSPACAPMGSGESIVAWSYDAACDAVCVDVKLVWTLLRQAYAWPSLEGVGARLTRPSQTKRSSRWGSKTAPSSACNKWDVVHETCSAAALCKEAWVAQALIHVLSSRTWLGEEGRTRDDSRDDSRISSTQTRT
jgi:hypothetical protein